MRPAEARKALAGSVAKAAPFVVAGAKHRAFGGAALRVPGFGVRVQGLRFVVSILGIGR